MTRLSGDSVLCCVAEFYGLSPGDLKGRCREQRIGRPRQIAYYLVRRLCPHLSSPAIGRIFGGRDHTTVLAGIASAQRRISNRPDVQDAVYEILTLLAPGQERRRFIRYRIIAAERHLLALQSLTTELCLAPAEDRRGG